MATIDRVDKVFDKVSLILAYIGCVFLFMPFLSLIYNIFIRMFFHSSFYYNMETVQYFCLLAMCLGIPRTTYIRQHIRVNMLIDALPDKVHKVIDIIIYFVAFAAFLLIGYFLFLALSSKTVQAQHTQALHLQYTTIYTVMAVAFAVSSLVFLYQCVREIVTFNVPYVKAAAGEAALHDAGYTEEEIQEVMKEAQELQAETSGQIADPADPAPPDSDGATQERRD